MTQRGSIRQRPFASRSKVLGVLAAFWLNMAVLPCAMALESEHDCPHCPPAQAEQMAGHHAHAEAEAGPPCATMTSECCDLDEAGVHSRSGKLKPNLVPDIVFVTAAAVPDFHECRPGRVSAVSDPPDIAGSSPPLHVLHCVYLD